MYLDQDTFEHGNTGWCCCSYFQIEWPGMTCSGLSRAPHDGGTAGVDAVTHVYVRWWAE